jgi:tetratricopeptide (TPR) repeat protein
MLRGFRTGRAANALLQEVTGMDNAEIDIAFNRYIESKFATALTAVAAESDDETDQPPAYIRLLGEGAAALANDDLAIAEAKLLEAQKLFTRHAGPDSSYVLLAEVYRRQGDPEAAAQQLAANVAIDADDLASHRRLAKLLVDLGEDGEAMDIYRRALYIQPFAIDLHDGLANLATRSGDAAAAVDARQAIIYLDPPDLAEAHYELASALQMAGRRGDAKREVLAALEFAPLYEDALELLLQLQPETGTPADPDAVDQARRDQPNESG